MKRFLLFVGAILLFAGCTEDMSPSAPIPGGTGANILMMQMNYTASGSQLTVYIVSTHCDSNVLVTERDTSTGTYSIHGDTLLSIDSTNDTTKFKRYGSGNGLQGTWIPLDTATFSYGNAYMVVGASTMQVWVPKTYLIDEMKQGMLGAFQQLPGITVDTSVAGVIKLTGNTTHEVVTITANSQGQLVWSSTLASHTTFAYTMINPTTCPQEMMPAWLTEFMLANTGLVTLPKMSLNGSAIIPRFLR
jgi:hypothetical protein